MFGYGLKMFGDVFGDVLGMFVDVRGCVRC
jgi:hypothetical protein